MENFKDGTHGDCHILWTEHVAVDIAAVETVTCNLYLIPLVGGTVAARP